MEEDFYSTIKLKSGEEMVALNQLKTAVSFYEKAISNNDSLFFKADKHYNIANFYMTLYQKTKKIDHIKGKFSNIIKKDESKYKFEYIDTKTSKNITFQKEIHLIVNCIGSIDLENPNVPGFVKNIMAKEYCMANDSKIGFKVNDRFEASKNLHIAGPLLAGNVINDILT